MSDDISIVRIADLGDKEEIFRLLRLGHEESGLFPYDINRVDTWISRMLAPELIPAWDTGPRGVIGVIGEPDRLEGLIFLVIGCLWYTLQRHLEELIIYVEPKYRRLGRHRTLIEWAKEQSRLTGLPLMAGVLSKSRTEGMIRLYEKVLPQAGAVFCYDPITHGSSAAHTMAVH